MPIGQDNALNHRWSRGLRFWFLTEGTPSEPATISKEVSLFRRPRTTRDELRDQGQIELMTRLRASESIRGRLLLEESRLVLEELGQERGTLHAVPTEAGWVMLVPSQGLGTVLGFANFPTTGVTAGASDNSFGVAIYGLVREPKAEIDVTLANGERRAARVEGGAFFAQLSREDAGHANGICVSTPEHAVQIPISL